MRNKFLYASFLAAILLSLFVSIPDASGQTSRRKRTKQPQPVVSPTPQPQQQTVPTVVSRSDQYVDGNQIIYGQNQQTETTNQTRVAPETNVPVTENTNDTETRMRELNARIKSLESTNRNEYDEKQKRLLLNLDILSRAESRAESLRKQLFEMIEKENSLQMRIEQIGVDARPESIERSTAFVGSMRPEEVREQRRRALEAERRNLESLLTQIQTSRTTLEENVQKADYLVQRVRIKLDKEIDDALTAEEKP